MQQKLSDALEAGAAEGVSRPHLAGVVPGHLILKHFVGIPVAPWVTVVALTAPIRTTEKMWSFFVTFFSQFTACSPGASGSLPLRKMGKRTEGPRRG